MGLTEASHTFQVRATDAAGNTDATPASYTWTLDTTAPDTSITAQPANPTNATTASFSFTSSGGGVSFECQIDGGGFSACTSPRTYMSLVQGSHTFQVRAIDAAGNTDATPASYTWTIDTTAPTISITVKPTHGLSDEELEQMLLDSIDHAEDDMQKRLLAEQQVEARRVLIDAHKQIQLNGDLLSTDEKRAFVDAVQALEHLAASSTEHLKLKEAIVALDDQAKPFVERIMNRAIATAAVGKTMESF